MPFVHSCATPGRELVGRVAAGAVLARSTPALSTKPGSWPFAGRHASRCTRTEWLTLNPQARPGRQRGAKYHSPNPNLMTSRPSRLRSLNWPAPARVRQRRQNGPPDGGTAATEGDDVSLTGQSPHQKYRLSSQTASPTLPPSPSAQFASSGADLTSLCWRRCSPPAASAARPRVAALARLAWLAPPDGLV